MDEAKSYLTENRSNKNVFDVFIVLPLQLCLAITNVRFFKGSIESLTQDLCAWVFLEVDFAKSYMTASYDFTGNFFSFSLQKCFLRGFLSQVAKMARV